MKRVKLVVAVSAALLLVAVAGPGAADVSAKHAVPAFLCPPAC